MFGKLLDYVYAYTVPDGSHVINTLANTQEDFGLNWWPNNDPDARSLSELTEVAVVAPSSERIYVVFQSDVHTGTTSTIGYWSVRQGAVTIAGTRVRMTAGGPNRKRHYTMGYLIEGLAPGELVTLKWGIESSVAGGVSAGILHNSTEVAPHAIEVWDIEGAAPAGAAVPGPPVAAQVM